MRDFYKPHYEYLGIKRYQRIGFEVSFNCLSSNQSKKFIEKGFAPAIPIEVSTMPTDNYIYPVSWGDTSDIPFW